MATDRHRIISVADAQKDGPPAAGNLAGPVFSHGTLQEEWYAPLNRDTQTPHTRDEIHVVATGNSDFFNGGTSQAC